LAFDQETAQAQAERLMAGEFLYKISLIKLSKFARWVRLGKLWKCFPVGGADGSPDIPSGCRKAIQNDRSDYQLDEQNKNDTNLIS
jgi:hypothetical protein